MVDLFSNKRQQDANSQVPSRELLSNSNPSANLEAEGEITEKPNAGLGTGFFRAGLFARPWTRRDKAVVGSLGCLAVVIIALIIALPIVFVGERNGHGEYEWQPYRPKHEDPSYHIERNKPIQVLWNFPDPGLLNYNGTWYAFGTNPLQNDPSTIHVPVATSTNFVNWALHKGYDALPTIGAWEREINHWAPDVIQRDDGRFVLYYSGQAKDFGRHHCVGTAISEGDDPLGPYIPSDVPLACPREYGGAIDPSPFRDVDGKLYVVYKADGNSVGSGGYCGNSKMPRKPVPILLQELETDGVTAIGDPTMILNIIKSDGSLVEAPDIMRTEDGTYYLFFSTHCYTALAYDVQYAHSKSLKGPYTRAARPLLQTGDFGLTSPGGATVSPDGTKMVFHAYCGRWRCMYASAIDIRPSSDTIVLSSLQPRIPGIPITNSTISF